jgi:hypothetical protein
MIRRAGIVIAAALGSLVSGCAVYSTPSGEIIGPAPVVVSPPPVVVSPFFYYGHTHRHRHYSAPRYYSHRVPHGAPRYYGRPYHRF